MYKLKIIKSKNFTVQDTDHTHYVAAYKGRVFGVSTLRFEDNPEDLVADKGVLTIKCDIEVLKNTSTDPLDGSTKTYLDIVPKAGLSLAAF